MGKRDVGLRPPDYGAQMDEPAPEAPGFLMPGVWLVVALVVVLGAVGAVGAMGYGSESAGMMAAHLASFPLGFVCSGAAAAVVVHFVVKGGPFRIAVPLGCGCLGGGALFAGLMGFFAVIWPSL